MKFKDFDQASNIFNAKLDEYIKLRTDWEKQEREKEEKEKEQGAFAKFFTSITKSISRPPENIPGPEGVAKANEFKKQMNSCTSTPQLIALTDKAEFKKGIRMPKVLKECIQDITTDFANMVKTEKKEILESSKEKHSARMSAVQYNPETLKSDAEKKVHEKIVKECKITAARELKSKESVEEVEDKKGKGIEFKVK